MRCGVVWLLRQLKSWRLVAKQKSPDLPGFLLLNYLIA